MSPVDSIQRLDETHIDQVPRSELLRLLEPLIVAEETMAQAGEYLLVPNLENLPPQLKHLLETLRRSSPVTAFVTLRTRNLITLLAIAETIHDGPGEAFSAGAIQTTSGPKGNIAPSPITAELVSLSRYKASELPKNHPIVLAASYQCTSYNGTIRLTRIEESEVPSSSGFIGMMTAGLYLRKGISFTLVEQDGHLMLKKWGNENDSIVIHPDCELEVCIPAVR